VVKRASIKRKLGVAGLVAVIATAGLSAGASANRRAEYEAGGDVVLDMLVEAGGYGQGVKDLYKGPGGLLQKVTECRALKRLEQEVKSNPGGTNTTPQMVEQLWQANAKAAEAERKDVENLLVRGYDPKLGKEIGELKGHRDGVPLKDRALFDTNIARLEMAHAKHGEEFFHLAGAFNELQTKNCDGAEAEGTKAKITGHSWGLAALAMRELELIYNIKLEVPWYPRSPYYS
jgi:hypothetical protein